jgi:hypothetical protein
MDIWLVVWNMNFIFPATVGNVIIPTDELISEGLVYHQPASFPVSSSFRTTFF